MGDLIRVTRVSACGRFVIDQYMQKTYVELHCFLNIYSLFLWRKELFHHVLKFALMFYADIVNMIVYFNGRFVRCVFHFRGHPITPASPV